MVTTQDNVVKQKQLDIANEIEAIQAEIQDCKSTLEKKEKKYEWLLNEYFMVAIRAASNE